MPDGFQTSSVAATTWPCCPLARWSRAGRPAGRIPTHLLVVAAFDGHERRRAAGSLAFVSARLFMRSMPASSVLKMELVTKSAPEISSDG
jgi:hypothetical protein